MLAPAVSAVRREAVMERWGEPFMEKLAQGELSAKE